MEAGGESLFAVGIDSEKRNSFLEIIENAADVPRLLEATRRHFDQQVTSLTAERLLEEFRDDDLSDKLKNTEGFDRDLFRAVLLFELAHLEGGDSNLAEQITAFSDFWRGNANDTAEGLERTFTAETKRAHYEPFPAMSQFVMVEVSMHEMDKYLQTIKKPDTSKVDPLQEEIDGKQHRVFMGDREIRLKEHPVLTHQLLRDLSQYLPGPIVDELKYRFPDDGIFEDIQPLIEKIQAERAENIMPPEDELIDRYRKLGGSVLKQLRELDSEEEIKKRSQEYFVQSHRSLGSRITGTEIYIPGSGDWYTITMLESDTEHNVYYRRVYRGDITADDRIEVPLDERAQIAEFHDREFRQEVPFKLSDPRTAIIRDIFGSYNP